MPDTPKYRIQTVTDMTGVAPATLRAWERRYGFPKPDRREGGSYRLYSQKDVEQVRRMVELTERGLAASEAAKAVQEQAERWAPLAGETIDEEVYETAARRIVEAASSFDPSAVEEAVQRSLLLGPATELYDKIFEPAMTTIGVKWAAKEIGVGQEHLASQVVSAAIKDLIRLSLPTAPRGSVILACLSEEQHELPIYGVALRIAREGWRPVLLGARTPPEAIEAAVSAAHPSLIGLSVTVPIQDDAKPLFARYGRAAHPVRWVVGGRAALKYQPEITSAGGSVINSARALLEHLPPG